MGFKVLLPPRECVECVSESPCRECDWAPESSRDPEQIKHVLERLTLYYLSGDYLRGLNVVRRELGLPPLEGGRPR